MFTKFGFLEKEISIFNFARILFILYFDLWEASMDTIAIIFVSVFVSVILGIPIGILGDIFQDFMFF